jgi:pantoate--beta-alanine ligase
VRDLNMQAQIEICPTVREPDGLAMSSRNVHLSPDERLQATALHRALDSAAALIGAGETDAEVAIAAARAELDAAGVSTEYFQIVNGETLAPMQTIEGPALALVAARVGSTRLIDNQQLTTAERVAGSGDLQAAGSN